MTTEPADATTTENDDTADEPQAEAPASSRIRIPNVRPGAVSGLDHELLDPVAAAAEEADQQSDQDDAPTDAPEDRGLLVPSGTLDEQIDWVKAAEDQPDRSERADALWSSVTIGDPQGDHSDLAAALRVAVNGEEPSTEEVANGQTQVVIPELPADDGSKFQVNDDGEIEKVAPTGEVEGETVESETDQDKDSSAPVGGDDDSTEGGDGTETPA